MVSIYNDMFVIKFSIRIGESIMELLDFKPQLRQARMPIGSRPKIEKLGTFRINVVEATPIEWNGRLLFAEWIRSFNGPKGEELVVDGKNQDYTRFLDPEKNETVGKFTAFGCTYISAFKDGDRVYVSGTRRDTKTVDVFSSTDLENWELVSSVETPDYVRATYNTSMCKGPDGYVMVIEISGDKTVIGRGFTIIFATSKDMKTWEIKPIEQYSLFKDRYTACPSIRYYDGYYYVVYLECWPTFRLEPTIVRTKDMETYELGFFNPFMRIDDDDKKIMYPDRFTDEEIDYIENAVDINVSDFDFCDYNGKTRIVYSWGNQLGKEFLAQAEYDGSLEQLLKSHFID